MTIVVNNTNFTPITNCVSCPSCQKIYDIGLSETHESVLDAHYSRNQLCKKWVDLLTSNDTLAKNIQYLVNNKHSESENACYICNKTYSNPGNLNKHLKNNPECLKHNLWSKYSGNMPVEGYNPETNNTKFEVPNVGGFDKHTYKHTEPQIIQNKELTQEIFDDYMKNEEFNRTNFLNFYDSNDTTFGEAPDHNDSKLFHIIWSLYLTDKESVKDSEALQKEIKKNNIHYVMSITPCTTVVADVDCDNILYKGHDPVISNEEFDNFNKFADKIDDYRMSRKNTLIYCNNGYQRSLPFICNYLISRHGDEVPNLDKALDICLSQIDAANYNNIKEGTKKALMLITKEDGTTLFRE